jgi:hypothetical protein
LAKLPESEDSRWPVLGDYVLGHKSRSHAPGSIGFTWKCAMVSMDFGMPCVALIFSKVSVKALLEIEACFQMGAQL